MSDSVPAPDDSEIALLARWRGGDRTALDALLGQVMPWLQAEVRRSMRERAPAHLDSSDLLQTTVLNFLEWGPKFVPASGAQFRALLKRIATNELIDQCRRAARAGRHFESLRPTGPSLSGFGPRVPSDQRASQIAMRDDESNWVRLALQFLEPDERFLLIASEVENRDWAAIARELELPSADAARVRAARLKPRAANLLRRLKCGRMPDEDVAASASLS
jgi:DNA-directed RNA polymerase specialized sigma24 family protein